MSGDRPRFEEQERLDLVDLDAVSDLVYDHLDRAFGGLIGPCNGGAFGKVEFTYESSGPVIEVQKAILYDGAGGKDAGTEMDVYAGKVLQHDPSLEGQTSTIDLSTHLDSSDIFLWARATPTLTAADSANRRKWNVVSGEEEVTAINTRRRQRVEFGAGNTAPAGDGWFRFALVVEWSGAGADPTILTIPAWDNTWEELSHTLGFTTWQNRSSYWLAKRGQEGADGPSFGLALVIQGIVRLLLGMIYGPTLPDHEEAAEQPDANSLPHSLTSLGTQVTSLGTQAIKAASFVSWDGAAYAINGGAFGCSVGVLGTGYSRITFTGTLPTTTVVASPYNESGETTPQPSCRVENLVWVSGEITQADILSMDAAGDPAHGPYTFFAV